MDSTRFHGIRRFVANAVQALAEDYPITAELAARCAGCEIERRRRDGMDLDWPAALSVSPLKEWAEEGVALERAEPKRSPFAPPRRGNTHAAHAARAHDALGEDDGREEE